MEEKFNGGFENHEERRDYARNDGPRGGYSSEGRKLRPRRKVGYSGDNHRNYKGFGEGRPERGEERPRYGEEKPRYGEGRPH